MMVCRFLSSHLWSWGGFHSVRDRAYTFQRKHYGPYDWGDLAAGLLPDRLTDFVENSNEAALRCDFGFEADLVF